MNNILIRFAIALFLSLSGNALFAKPVDTIESSGVYVVAEKGFVKIGSYSRTERYVDFNYLHEIPFVKRGSQILKLIVYEKNFHGDHMLFELRPIDIKVDHREIKFDVKPMSKPDMYELTTEKPVPDGFMLQVNGNFYSNSFGVIMLGEPQAQLIKYFSQKNLSDAPIVVQYLDDARAAFPNNTELKELSKYWVAAASRAKDAKAYTYVEEKWTQYQQAEKLKLKSRYLSELIGEINGYLNDHPAGLKAKEANERKKHAAEKLKEYEKLL